MLKEKKSHYIRPENSTSQLPNLSMASMVSIIRPGDLKISGLDLRLHKSFNRDFLGFLDLQSNQCFLSQYTVQYVDTFR